MIDLVVLAADLSMKAALDGILKRPESLGIKPTRFEILAHPQHDPGCLRDGVDFLRAYHRRASHALVVFDRHGCGKNDEPREKLEAAVELQLHGSGWDERARAIVIEPELETWVWTKSPHVSRALGWGGDIDGLWEWLAAHGYFESSDSKPSRPKAAKEAALREKRKPGSAALFGEIAASLSLKQCIDPAFLKLKNTLAGWFPRGS